MNIIPPVTIKKKQPQEEASNLAGNSFMPPALAQGAYDQVQSNLTGASFDPYELGARKAFQKSAVDARAAVSDANVGRMGQGGAVENQQTIDSAVRSNLTDLYVGMAQGRNEARNTGVTQASNLAEFEQKSGQAALDNAIKLGSVEGTQDAYARMTGMKVDPQSLRLALGDQKFASIAGRIANGATIEQVNAEFGEGTLSADQYDSMVKASQQGQFYSGLSSDEKKFYDNLDASMKLSYEQMSQQDRQFFAGLGSD